MIVLGDSLEKLKEMAPDSIDSIVTDPPYGLKFMGKKWDYEVPTTELWRECLRVLKPGGHMLVACGTRTQHRMAVNIEDAGFEIRDVITWLYGSGFPKSLDVSKAIDKAAGAERESLGVSENTRDRSTHVVNAMNKIPNNPIQITAPPTPEAKQWQGWGTALKPACEFWTLARKPLGESTVAKNTLKHGTGGINVDGCRVATDALPKSCTNNNIKNNSYASDNSDKERDTVYTPNTQGRFPANLILDEEAGALLDEQSGVLTSGKFNQASKKAENSIYGKHDAYQDPKQYEATSGGASRFFFKVESELKHDSLGECNHSLADIVKKNSETIQATLGHTAPLNVVGLREEQLAQNVKSAGIQCDSCATLIAQELVKMWSLDFKSAALQAYLDSIGNFKNFILTQSLVSIAEKWASTGITPTTQNLSRLFGCAHLAIEENTNSESQKNALDPELATRFRYVAKASKSERNAGQSEQFNVHPTCKPLRLMRYLCRLITPPNGVVLDPFAGSGSTLIAAKLEGFEPIGIEREPEYVEIAKRRLEHQCQESLL